jgi:hypothetical protein
VRLLHESEFKRSPSRNNFKSNKRRSPTDNFLYPPPADEMVMVMGVYDLETDGANKLYAFNGVPNYIYIAEHA